MVRLAFGSIAFIISFLLIRKSRVIHKRRWLIITFVIAVILTTLSALIPIENELITFSSPKSAYNYAYQGLSKFIQKDILKDIYLKSLGYKIEWHFYWSELSQSGGSSGSLRKALIEAHIKIIEPFRR